MITASCGSNTGIGIKINNNEMDSQQTLTFFNDNKTIHLDIKRCLEASATGNNASCDVGTPASNPYYGEIDFEITQHPDHTSLPSFMSLANSLQKGYYQINLAFGPGCGGGGVTAAEGVIYVDDNGEGFINLTLSKPYC
ncbi:MAG TPA: hypothetical protein PKC21_06755 [Oligoflexia bacterium]|nr:hypothetical protein [Oligoflexia bacterium]